MCAYFGQFLRRHKIIPAVSAIWKNKKNYGTVSKFHHYNQWWRCHSRFPINILAVFGQLVSELIHFVFILKGDTDITLRHSETGNWRHRDARLVVLWWWFVPDCPAAGRRVPITVRTRSTVVPVVSSRLYKLGVKRYKRIGINMMN